MNIQKFLVNIIAAGLVISGAGSCSVMESISSKLPGNTSTENAENTEKEKKKAEERERKTAEKAAKEKKAAEKKARDEKKKSSKSNQPVNDKNNNTVPSKKTDTSSTGVPAPDFTDGTWHLRSINGYTLSADTDGDDGERPYLIFEKETGRFYGNDGCNTVNGNFYAQHGESLRFGDMISTMRMCPDAKYAHEFLTAMSETRTCRITGNEAESLIEFRNDKGKTLMTLAKPAMEFLNGSWQVIKIDGHSVDSPDLKLVIDLPERRIHGNTGCNVLNGTIFIDPDKSGTIQFQQFAVTLAFCPDAKWETPLLVALESVETVDKPTGNESIVNLLDTHGKIVLTLRPLPLND